MTGLAQQKLLLDPGRVNFGAALDEEPKPQRVVINFIVLGVPVAKKRPRFFLRGKHVGTYNAQETEEGRLRLDIARQLPVPWTLLKGPIRVICRFYMRRPKSHYGTGKNSNTLKQKAPLYHTSTPDIDNLQKTVYDCCNQVVWGDDACVFESVSRKEYSDSPRTEITVEVFNDG